MDLHNDSTEGVHVRVVGACEEFVYIGSSGFHISVLTGYLPSCQAPQVCLCWCAGVQDMSLDCKELNTRLRPYLVDICTRALSNGRRDGDYWKVGSIQNDTARPGGLGGSCVVFLTGNSPGSWKDFASEDHGDIVDLITHALCGGDKKAGYREGCRIIGYVRPTGEDGKPQPYRSLPPAPQAAPPKPLWEQTDLERQMSPRQRIDAKRNLKNSISLYTTDSDWGCNPALDYLVHTRGIDLLGPVLGRFKVSALKYNPRCFHPSTKKTHPALLAFIVDWHGLLTFQRIYLARQSNGHFDKLPGVPNKMYYGKVSGGIIPVWRGMDALGCKADGTGGKLVQKPHYLDAHYEEEILLTEGIEDALSVALMMPHRRVVAMGHLGNLSRIHLPNGISSVWFFAQNDTPKVIEFREQEMERLLSRGIAVRYSTPQAGIKDFNDLVRNPLALRKYCHDLRR